MTFEQFLMERSRIRKDPRLRFTAPVRASQLLPLALRSHLRFRIGLSDRAVVKLRDRTLAYPGLGTMVILLPYAFSDVGLQRRFLMEFLLLSSKELERVQEFFVNSEPHQGKTKRTILNESRSKEFRSMFDKVMKSRRRIVSGDSTQTSQMKWKEMHLTGEGRQADGNIVMIQEFERRSKLRKRTNRRNRALFVGGSLGLVAFDFWKRLRATRRREWSLMSMDLFPPGEISKRWLKRKDGQFLSLPGHLHYVVASMGQVPFRRNSFDLIDACNVLGYIDDLNERLDILTGLWRLLRIGGFLKQVGPNLESNFEQMIVKKTGAGLSDWKLVYVSPFGKNNYPKPLEPSVEIGKALTQAVCAARKEVCRRGKSRAISKRSGNALRDSLVRDLYYLSPITFGAGLYDDFRLSPKVPEYGTKKYQKALLEQLAVEAAT